jgi:hypothetical protein
MPRTVWNDLLRALIDGLYDGLDVKRPGPPLFGIPGLGEEKLKAIDPAAMKRIERECDMATKPPIDMVRGKDGVWRVSGGKP